jgi:hypothetical protein
MKTRSPSSSIRRVERRRQVLSRVAQQHLWLVVVGAVLLVGPISLASAFSSAPRRSFVPSLHQPSQSQQQHDVFMINSRMACCPKRRRRTALTIQMTPNNKDDPPSSSSDVPLPDHNNNNNHHHHINGDSTSNSSNKNNASPEEEEEDEEKNHTCFC